MKTNINLFVLAILQFALVKGVTQQPPTIQFTSTIYTISETSGVATITVEFNWGDGDPFTVYTVDYATSNGTAIAGLDYVAQSGTLWFEYQETNKSFTISILDDGLVDCAESAESVQLTLSNPIFEAVLNARSSAVLVIRDTDPLSGSVRTWIDKSRAFTRQALEDITFATGIFVAVGLGPSGGQAAAEGAADPDLAPVPYANLLTSSDGITWTGRLDNPIDVYLYGVAYGNGKFVAVGGVCGVKGCSVRVLTSPDGTTWTYSDSVTELRMHGALNAVAFGNGTFVAVGGSNLVTSPDGETWTPEGTNGWRDLFDITFGDGRFVAVGGSAALTSVDGTNWQQETNLDCCLTRLTFARGRFVALGQRAIFTSTDGLAWTRCYEGGVELSSVTETGSAFVALSATGGILTSADAITWACQMSPGGNAVAFGNDTLVIVGDDGNIFLSVPVRPNFRNHDVRRLADGTMRLVVEGDPFHAVVSIEASPDLFQWTPLTTLTNFTGTMEFLDADAGQLPRRFYRVGYAP